MAKEFAKEFYNSKKWRKCRVAYIQERILLDGGLCERCREKTGYIVHHKIHLTKFNINNPDITLNHNNLEYLCKVCHDLEPNHWEDKLNKPKTLCLFDSEGNAIKPIHDRRRKN